MECPTLVLHGERDLRPMWAAEKLAELLPNARLVRLPGGHFPWLEAPSELRQALREFISEIWTQSDPSAEVEHYPHRKVCVLVVWACVQIGPRPPFIRIVVFELGEVQSPYTAEVRNEQKKPPPIFVTGLFNEVRNDLLEVLEGLSPFDWQRPTAAPHWSVKDIALHLLEGDLGNLSRRRDGFLLPGGHISEYRDLVAFVNELNEQWVSAARRLSPRVLCDLLAFTGPQLAEFFRSLDPFALGEPVSWAGPDPAPVWLDVAREYTEQWHHQQQIRDATARPPLYSPRLFAPVLDTFMRATPHHFKNAVAPEGTFIEIKITGEAGGQWFLCRSTKSWELFDTPDKAPATYVSIPQDAA